MKRLINWWNRFTKQSRVYQLEQWIHESIMTGDTSDAMLDFRMDCRKELKELKDELEQTKS
jgi:hypothetical protein